MRTLFVEPVGGVAGDMLLAALLDAGAPLEPIADAVANVLGRRIEIGTQATTRRGLRALELVLPEGLERAPDLPVGPRDLVERVEQATLLSGVRERAVAVLTRLGEAEARVHGVPFDRVQLEELGSDDTLVDIVGVCAALDAHEVDSIVVAALPLTKGARATLELLRGFDVRPPDAPTELGEPVTPTGAAILAAVGEPSPEVPEMRLEAVGVGAGTRDPEGVANVVRVLLGTLAEGRGERRLIVVEANVDDLTPELVPDALDGLLQAGALDAWLTPIVMKRGRPAVTISALCETDDVPRVRRAFFEHTTTLGVRVHGVSRPELERRVVEIELAEGGPVVRVKVAYLDGRAVNAKPEHDDVVEAARKLDRPVRAVHESASALAHRLLEEQS
ncbi:MAG: LarC family nickel insertion protein [Actinomycetota bacterium]